MCLLIQQPKNKSVSKEKLFNAYENNDDGAGFCYSDNGRIVINKFRSFKKFYKHYNRAIKTHGVNSDFIIHFRMSTHGTNNGTFNVHPFKINNKLAFAHNGIISGGGDSKKLTDTQLFNKRVLKNLPNNFIKNNIVQTLLGDYIGNSKLVFLDNAGESFIVNKEMGHRDKSGVWFSNDSYECNYGYCYGGYNYKHIAWNDTKRYKGGEIVSLSGNKGKYKECDFCGTYSPNTEIVESFGEINQLCTSCKPINI